MGLLIAVFSMTGPAIAQVSYDLALGVDGSPPAGWVESLTLAENGVQLLPPMVITSTKPLVTLYLDIDGSRDANVRRWAAWVADSAEKLAAQGNFEIVVADPLPVVLVRRGSDAERIRDAMNGLASRQGERDSVARLRSTVLTAVKAEESGASAGQSSALLAATPQEPQTADQVIEASYLAEVAVRRRRADALLLWMAQARRSPASGETAGGGSTSSPAPALLLLLSDDLALPSWDRYSAHSQATDQASALEVATVAAAFAWTLAPLTAGFDGDVPGSGGSSTSTRAQSSPAAPIGFRLGLGGQADRVAGAAESVSGEELGLTLVDDRVFQELAQLTGGSVVTGREQLVEVATAFDRRQVVRVMSTDGGLGVARQLQWQGVSGLVAPQLAVVGTPFAVSEARARFAMESLNTDGQLTVRSAIEFDQYAVSDAGSLLEARLNLDSLRRLRPELGVATFRVTVGVHLESNEVLMRHEEVANVSLAGLGEWRFETRLRLPPETDGAVVLVESLSDGDWGESFAAFVARKFDSEQTSAGPLAGRSPRLLMNRAIRLIGPDADLQVGKIDFRVEVVDTVKRVVYLLDGEKVDTQRRAPFNTTIDLGSRARQRLVVAIAYGSGGIELGRDGVMMNEAALTFNLRITEPPPGKRSGPVDVEAAIKVPVDSRVAAVDFFWQDQLVGTRRQPPWRQRVFIPLTAEPGFIRAAARLDDGRVAEDVILMNGDRFGDEVTVRLVELYVVVTDRQGKPVNGLPIEEFQILEEGVPQKIESFEAAGGLPITVGLAIDSSLSLFMRMSEVQRAAQGFVDGLLPGQDQAFLVGFGSTPRVVRATTTRLENIQAGIRSLEPGGTTAIWEAVVLSLLELQENSGRKALVVFYDGDDEDENFSFDASVRLAQELGVPIYLIVMNDAAARSGGQSFGTKTRASRLQQLAAAGGGKVYYVRTDADLDEVFKAITAELRAHYLLTYYPSESRSDEAPGWREVGVTVERRGLEARTLSGYGNLLRARN